MWWFRLSMTVKWCEMAVFPCSRADGAAGWRSVVGFGEQCGSGDCVHYKQRVTGAVGRVAHLSERWETYGVQSVSVQHSVLSAGLWSSGEIDTTWTDTTGGETHTRTHTREESVDTDVIWSVFSAQEPSECLEESLAFPQTEFTLKSENGGAEEDTENPDSPNPSPEIPRMCSNQQSLDIRNDWEHIVLSFFLMKQSKVKRCNK